MALGSTNTDHRLIEAVSRISEKKQLGTLALQVMEKLDTDQGLLRRSPCTDHGLRYIVLYRTALCTVLYSVLYCQTGHAPCFIL